MTVAMAWWLQKTRSQVSYHHNVPAGASIGFQINPKL